ncbi:MAG: mechanosensitive ion channel family protein [Oligosphaeraceae bacterium]
MSEDPAIPSAETAIQNVVDAVRHTDVQTFWQQHQESLLHLGKSLLLGIGILVLAWGIAALARKLILRATRRFDAVDESVGKILAGVARAIIWLFALLIILDLMGINTASILTVLGAAGLAVGLAMKDSLSNIAAGIMLLFLRPYKLGDYIDCGSVSGTIREIGLFTTTLTTPDGLYIAAPNSVLFGSPIKNYSRNPQRRADITVGIDYGDSLAKGVETLLALMKRHPLILQDPAPEVLVSELADSSVNLTLRFWTANQNYWEAYWSVKAQLKDVLEGAGLNIPFPQRVVTLQQQEPARKG